LNASGLKSRQALVIDLRAWRSKCYVCSGRKLKLTRQEIDHVRKMIDAGERREDVAALLDMDRTTL